MKKIIRKWLGIETQEQRDFQAARLGRLTADWFTTSNSADASLRPDVKMLRDRCRALERDNDYVRRYLSLVTNNVLGSTGIGLQMKIREMVRHGSGWFEQYDKLANDYIEIAWDEWGRAEHCSTSRVLPWAELQRVVLRSVARDGAALVRKHYRKTDKYAFRLEPLEIDHLDTDYVLPINSGGNVVRLGVEYAADGQVTAYWLKRDHPGEVYYAKAPGVWVERIPASQIYHVFKPDRINQSTGYPWLSSAILNLNQLGQYQEAEVVAARIAAAKMGFLVAQQGTGASGGYTGQSDGVGNKYMDVSPGSIEALPYGYNFQTFDPTHPTTAYAEFVKAMLRSVASGLGVSYTSLANDLEGVNYSSIRAGLLEEREEWKSIQRWFIDVFIRPVFEDWLRMALAGGALPLPASRFDKFNHPEFKPRRWPWVDPLKDMQAQVMAVEKGFSSRRSVIADAGGDIEEVFTDLESDAQLAKLHGLEFSEKGKPPVDKPEDVDG